VPKVVIAKSDRGLNNLSYIHRQELHQLGVQNMTQDPKEIFGPEYYLPSNREYSYGWYLNRFAKGIDLDYGVHFTKDGQHLLDIANIDRTCPILIKYLENLDRDVLIEELMLKIVEIPDDIKYTIESHYENNYGMEVEYVAEVHRKWE